MNGALRRRGRRAVLTGLVLFATAQGLLGVSLEGGRPDLREPEFGCRLRLLRRQLDAAPGRPVVVALGSSRTQMGLSPSALGLGADAPLVFNFGKAGGGTLRQLLMLRRLLAEGVRPERVLVEVLPAHLFDDAPGEEMVSVGELGWAELKGFEPYCAAPSAARADWVAAQAAGWYAVRFCVLSRLEPGLLPWQACKRYVWENLDPFGWSPFPKPTVAPEQRRQYLEATRWQYGRRLEGFHVSPVPDRALRELLDLCRSEGIPAALYLMPEGPFFAALHPPAVRGRIDAYVAGVARDFGAPLFDARDWVPEEEFADSHHLLPVGAARFSERFGRECLVPWLVDPRPLGEGRGAWRSVE